MNQRKSKRWKLQKRERCPLITVRRRDLILIDISGHPVWHADCLWHERGSHIQKNDPYCITITMVHSCATVVDCLALINTLIWVCICLRVFSPFIHPFKHLISLKRFTKLNVRELSLSLLKVKNPIEYFGIHWGKSQRSRIEGGKIPKKSLWYLFHLLFLSGNNLHKRSKHLMKLSVLEVG